MTKAKRYMLRGVTLILLAAILQTYVCSALCGVEDHWLCKERATHKECCNHDQDEHRNNDANDCQKDHLAFLQTIGQFHSKDGVSVTKIFQPISLTTFSQIITEYTALHSEAIAFTGFRPPPPKDGIPVIVQSFLI